MKTRKTQPPSKRKTLLVFILTIILGYIGFVIPDVFFGVTKINGGKIGINLLYIALFQLVYIIVLLYTSLKILNKDFRYIGVRFKKAIPDILLGTGFGLIWAFIQFQYLIPISGASERTDIQSMLSMYDGTVMGLVSYLGLGIIGGGITEELFNRAYFIAILKDVFTNPKVGCWVSALLSIILFALGHLPNTALLWFDILVPTIIYTLLFIYTRRITASILAHSVYNASAILLTYYIYFQ